MAYINLKGETRLVKGDRVILKEKHENCLYSFAKGEECEIKYAMDNGDNCYAIASLDDKKLIDFVRLGGLNDNSIVITRNISIDTTTETKQKSNTIGTEMLLQMFKFAERQLS